MKRYVGTVFIIGALLNIVEAHATVFATAVLRRGNNTVYLLADMPDESDVAIKQREAVLVEARKGMVGVIADDCNDLQAVMSVLLSDERVTKKLAAEQERVNKNAERAQSLLPSLVTLGRQQGLPVANMDYESTMLREDMSLGAIRALSKDLEELVQTRGNYLLSVDQGGLSKCSSVVSVITEQTKQCAEAKEALYAYAMYSKYLLAFDAAETLKDTASLIVCAAPENIAFIGDRLSRGGWTGDTSQVERLAMELMGMRSDWITARGQAKEALEKLKRSPSQQQRGKKARSSAQPSQAKLEKNFKEKWEKTPAQLRKQELVKIKKLERYAPVDLTAFFQDISALRSLVSESSSAAQSSVPVGVEPQENEQELPEPKPWITVVLDEQLVDGSTDDDNSDASPDDHAGKLQAGPSLAVQSVPVEEPVNVLVVPTIDADNQSEGDEPKVDVQQKQMDASLADELTLVRVPSEDNSEDNNESTVKPSWFSANKAFVVGCGVTAAVVAGCVLAYKNSLFDGLCKKLNSFGWF